MDTLRCYRLMAEPPPTLARLQADHQQRPCPLERKCPYAALCRARREETRAHDLQTPE